MPHFKTMFDPSDFLFAHDLDGKEVVVVIEKVIAGEITGERGKTNKKPIAFFQGKKKRLALNKTNAKTIATLYGPETDRWAGQPIAIYPTTTSMGGETVDCIRVKNTKPAVKP